MSFAAERRLVEAMPARSSSFVEVGVPAAPVRPLSLRLNFSWVLAGNLARAGCRFGALLLLAYFCGLASAGRYAIAVALCNPIWAIVMLGLRGSLITDTRGEYSFADYLAVRLIASGIGLAAVAGVVLLGGYGVEVAAVILLVAFARLFEGISDILHGRLQQHERMDRISIALVIQGVTGLSLMVVVGILGGGTALMVASFPVAAALTLLFWDLPCSASISRATSVGSSLWRQPLRWATLGRLSVVAFPIAVAAFLIALIPQMPKYVINSIMGDEAVGVYAMISYWITLGMMVVAAMGNASAPRLAKYHASGDVRRFSRLLVRLVALVGGMGVVGVALVALLGPVVATYLGQEDSDLPRLALTLTLFAATLYVTGPLGRALGAMRKFWLQTIAVGLGIAVAVLLLPWAVRNRGLIGAAEAMTLSMSVVALVTAGLVWRELWWRVRRENHSPTEAAA